MSTVSVSPGVSLPMADGPIPVNPAAASAPSAAAARIAGYDVARAVAVLGMIVVNYYGIFRTSLKEPLLFAGLADFLCGRAAVLFVMLAGVGVTLLSRRPLLAGTAEAMGRFRKGMIGRCAVLLVMGGLFRLVWNADILHFYALFLSVGAGCVTFSARQLWRLVVAFWLTAALLYVATLGDPGVPESWSAAGPFHLLVDDFLVSGYYAAFPWFAFLLVGIWFGRPTVMSRPEIHGRIFFWSLVLFVAAQLLMVLGPQAVSGQAGAEAPLAALFENNAFPASPLFALSAGSGAMLVLVAAMHLGRRPAFTALVAALKSAGQLSLTVYIGHVLLGLAVAPLFKSSCAAAVYPYTVTLFLLVVMAGQLFFAHAWCRRFGRGPLEWLLRRLSGTG